MRGIVASRGGLARGAVLDTVRRRRHNFRPACRSSSAVDCHWAERYTDHYTDPHFKRPRLSAFVSISDGHRRDFAVSSGVPSSAGLSIARRSSLRQWRVECCRRCTCCARLVVAGAPHYGQPACLLALCFSSSRSHLRCSSSFNFLSSEGSRRTKPASTRLCAAESLSCMSRL